MALQLGSLMAFGEVFSQQRVEVHRIN